MQTERRRRYALIEAEKITVDSTVPPHAIVHDMGVDFRSGTIELPEGKFDLANFMRTAKAIREGFERYWFEDHPYFRSQGCDTD